MLRAMPLGPGDILRDKLLVAWGQTAAVVSFGAIALAYGYDLRTVDTLALLGFAALMSMCSVCFGLAFDSTFPSFSWDNPNAINRGVRMIIPFLAGVGTLGLCAGALGASRVLLHGELGVFVGLAASTAIALALVGGSLRTARENIAALEV